VSASRALWLAIAIGVLMPIGALAQVAAQRVGLLLTVSHASSQPGPIDPSAAELHRSLQREFRYESLRVIERRHIDLGMQEIGGVDLPTGKRVEVRPLALSPSGVLISVDIPGTLQTDLRVPNRKQVVIGVDRYQDGKLILTLQPDY
jgi:hypothetical protein